MTFVECKRNKILNVEIYTYVYMCPVFCS